MFAVCYSYIKARMVMAIEGLTQVVGDCYILWALEARMAMALLVQPRDTISHEYNLRGRLSLLAQLLEYDPEDPLPYWLSLKPLEASVEKLTAKPQILLLFSPETRIDAV